MTYPEAIQFLYDLRWFGAKLGLSNTLTLAELAGNPQQRLRFIHVAGTNGKGSTCAMLESIYRAAGLRVGLFTSPHLVQFNERLQVNRRPVSGRDIVRLVSEMRALLQQGWGPASDLVDGQAPNSGHHSSASSLRQPHLSHPTFFEVVTVMALRYFAERRCDLVIWETGLGGRLDATNIVTPLVSVITNIQYDHQKWLGETLASIATEKAGIIKPGIPVVTGTDSPEALREIEKAALEHDAPLRVVAPQEIGRPPLDTLQVPLLGQHQKMNAAVALATVRTLASRMPVSDQSIRAGLARLDWPGRLQLVTRPSGQKILLDGAHNPGGAQALATALHDFFPGAQPSLILGILDDKDWAGMSQILAPLARQILAVPVHSERSAAPRDLAAVCHRANPTCEILELPSLSAALLETAQAPFIVIAGSLYLVGEAVELLCLTAATDVHERELNEWSARR